MIGSPLPSLVDNPSSSVSGLAAALQLPISKKNIASLPHSSVHSASMVSGPGTPSSSAPGSPRWNPGVVQNCIRHFVGFYQLFERSYEIGDCCTAMSILDGLLDERILHIQKELTEMNPEFFSRRTKFYQSEAFTALSPYPTKEDIFIRTKQTMMKIREKKCLHLFHMTHILFFLVMNGPLVTTKFECGEVNNVLKSMGMHSSSPQFSDSMLKGQLKTLLKGSPQDKNGLNLYRAVAAYRAISFCGFQHLAFVSLSDKKEFKQIDSNLLTQLCRGPLAYIRDFSSILSQTHRPLFSSDLVMFGEKKKEKKEKKG
eukprot:CAMPEP_0201492444 /NCGR_PEP_ID=MMETSP0151_2-20130828/33128_1 /ASSEMBLY_ACC=CAM_ASM_000257 /TAXON_ID=200890 /ORGANISM="Paramoeba atlantica, Strain 621/1 / CCAP 1560/9" /LENGTH=313 /DNA_ID=CAMNT_0047879249 /DNA_START=1 /DNA_END=938 /DNA_ORIENTATION=+